MEHPLKTLIQAADQAITAEDFDRLMDFYAEDAVLVVKPGMNATGKEQIRRAFVAIADHFKRSIKVRQGEMIVLESGDTALVIMETILETSGAGDLPVSMLRRATYVFKKSGTGQWLCTIDNSYGTDLLTH